MVVEAVPIAVRSIIFLLFVYSIICPPGVNVPAAFKKKEEEK